MIAEPQESSAFLNYSSETRTLAVSACPYWAALPLSSRTTGYKQVTTLIRLTKREDQTALINLATASGLFEPSQTDELAQMLDQFHSVQDANEIWLTDDDNGPVGVAYLAPERMTEGTWNLYLIAIHPDRQRQGRGKALLDYVLGLLTKRGERTLLVETSGTEDFDYVRTFYRNNGFNEEARIREFYAAGIDKVVYRKALGRAAG